MTQREGECNERYVLVISKSQTLSLSIYKELVASKDKYQSKVRRAFDFAIYDEDYTNISLLRIRFQGKQ